MADRTEVLETVREVVSDVLGLSVSEISADSRFVEDLGAESIQSVELVAAFEEAFEIEMDEDAALQVKTVDGAVDFICDALDEEPAA